jgi:methyl-accepting chemotaxis protein
MLKNMKIGPKVMVSLGALVALIAAVGVVGTINIRKIDAADTRLYEKCTAPMDDALDMAVGFQQIRVSLRDAIMAGAPDKAQNYLDRIKELSAKFKESQKSYSGSFLDDQDKKNFEAMSVAFDNYMKDSETISQLVLAGKNNDALALLRGDARKANEELQKAIDDVSMYMIKEGKNISDSNTVMANSAVRLMIGLIIAAAVAAAVLAMVLQRNVRGIIAGLLSETKQLIEAAKAGKLSTRADPEKINFEFREIPVGVNQVLDAVIGPITEAAEVMKAAASKDMTKRVNGSYKGDLDEFKANINLAINNLDQALAQVSEAVGQVSSASTQISSGSQALAEGANQQASSLEEVSSSLEEMAASTRQNSDNANQAKTLAAGARDSALQGNDAMKRMSQAIDKIKKSSDQTAKIIKTIDEIAFQTNLLALNAAVEAARAGEAGKGFAVVAQEVRNLSQRSAEAAKNTSNMIEESVRNADGGVKVSEEVAKTLTDIVGGATKVNDLIAEIAAASQEQTKGIDQVNVAVADMNKVTQQNAANSEESASAAEELNSQAEELAGMVGTFALSNATAGSRAGAGSAATNRAGKPGNGQKGKAPDALIIDQVGKAPVKVAARATAPVAKPVATPTRAVKPEQVVPLDQEELAKF